MTNRERFVNTLNFKPVDRMPLYEGSTWWNKTIHAWREEGLPKNLDKFGIFKYWGLDDHRQIHLLNCEMEIAEYQLEGEEDHVKIFIRDESDYEKILPALYPDDYLEDSGIADLLHDLKPAHDAGEFPIWFTTEGYFWFPRVLFGIQPHLYSFYEQPELYHRICNDLANYHMKLFDEFCSILVPDYIVMMEDMSYNNGPMISQDMYNEFVGAYYEKVLPAMKNRGVKVFVDTDGDFSMMIPWMQKSGIDGVTPLERQAGVDVNQIRLDHPDLLMLGGFDKMTMSRGEEAMREEFERLIPIMKSGGYILSVDHQTPPNVTMENYKIYRRLQDEYCGKYHC